MGWEVRHGWRRYLYRNRRVNGKPIKEYLAAKDRFGFGDLMAHDLDRLQRRQAELRRLARKAHADYRARIDDLLSATAATNADLRVLAEGMLYVLGVSQTQATRLSRHDRRAKPGIPRAQIGPRFGARSVRVAYDRTRRTRRG